MIHLIKLCVGVATVDELVEWRAQRRAQGFGRPDGLNYHRTRMMPKRRDEIAGKGSLYWVIAGVVRCRQRIVDLEAAVDSEGRDCCNILMDPEVIYTVPQPKRPFQGWRYLQVKDAPDDLSPGAHEDAAELTEELARLGLI
jgi:hypothetical protein